MKNTQAHFLNVSLTGFLGFALSLAVGLGVAAPSLAAEWPERPIKLIVPYPPGGLTDIVSRTLSGEVAKILGQPLVIENRAGAGGQIGLQAMMQSPRDGYTIGLVVPATMVTLPLTNREFPFNPLKDFEPITVAVDTYLTLVASPGLGVKSLAEFAAYGKANPGKLNYGTPGIGTSFHFHNVIMTEKMGIKAVHVPYTGEARVLTDVAGSQLHFALVSNAGKSLIDAGKIVALAVTSNKRVNALPAVPSFRELGVDFTSDGWVGYVAASGTPAPILQKLNAAFIAAMEVPSVKARFAEMGYIIVGNSPREFRTLVEKSTERYGELVRSGAVKLD